MRRFLPELIALPLLPFLILQGRRTRRRTPRLPPAPEPDAGVAGPDLAGAPLSLIAVGESPVAGVGVASHKEAITGQLAQALSRLVQRPVVWRAHGQNGITVGEALQRLLPHLPAQPVDIALVAFGVNDTTSFKPVRRWREDLRQLLAGLQERCAPRLILLAGVPPMGRFPALPQPLRGVMGLKAAALDAAARQLALSLPNVRHVALELDPADPTLMAMDGYHPSAEGCAAWARVLAETCAAEAQQRPTLGG